MTTYSFEELKHCVYRYRTFWSIEGDDRGDTNIVEKYLFKAKRDHTLEINAFLEKHFKDEKGRVYG